MKTDVHCHVRVRAWHKVVSVLLVASMFIDAPPVLAAIQSSTNSGSASQPPQLGPTYPKPVTTPTNVKANRKLPSFTPAVKTWTLSATPSDQEIFVRSPFEEPLVPVGGKSTADDNSALAQALEDFSKRSARDDFSALEGFLNSHPNSVWRISLLTNLGWLYRQTGWYSKSLAVWEQAWALGKKETAPQAKAIVDRALSELIVLNARVGRIERLGPLFEEIKGRRLVGSVREKIEGAKQGYNLMISRPDRGYRCGPQAVATLYRYLSNPASHSSLPFQEPSTVKGTSLTQNYLLAKKMGLDVIMAKRAPGSAVLIPSVVNWKVGHFAAVVSKEHGLYHLHDPTFSNDVLVSSGALDAEASGYFLVKNQPLPAGWTAVTQEEGKNVWGKGPNTTASPGENTSCPAAGGGGSSGGGDDPDSGGSATLSPSAEGGNYGGSSGPARSSDTAVRGCCNMAGYKIFEAVCSLTVLDTPLFYTPAYGPSVQFTVSYSQRETIQPSNFTYSNLGPLWTFNWLSYMVDTPGSPSIPPVVYKSGGGESSPGALNGAGTAYAPDPETGAVAVITGTDGSGIVTSYDYDYPDGSKQVYSKATTTTPRKMFMTESVDAQGNALTYTYDSYYRLVAVTDATGLVTTVSYNLTSDIYKVTDVTDPFGRTAHLNYTADGNLASSQDMLGMVSAYGYSYLDGYVSSLQTPYGTTTFDVGQDSSKRWVQATDPNGAKERVEAWSNESPDTQLSSFTASAPTGVNTGFLNYRNTFYWSKEAMMSAPGDYTKAKITHFDHLTVSGGASDTMAGVIESEQSALEGRVYYNYVNQPLPYSTGDNAFPTRITRILDNGHTQEKDFTYNTVGNVTQATDPAGRVTNLSYGNGNNTDLTSMTQKNGGSQDAVFSATYNSYHQPVTITDAAGQITSYTYDATTHQLTSVENALSQTTSYTYNGSHQLTTITDETSGGYVAFTYDGYGRIRTMQDLNGYVRTYDYDALDRVTKVTYPDSTYDQYIYANLDVILSKDRQNRWTRHIYNSQDKLVGEIDPQGRATTYERCMCGALIGIVDARGNRTKFDYDVQSRPISKTYADGSQYAYAYETTTSRLKTTTDPLSQVATKAYNDDDTLSEISYSNTTISTPSVSFGYDTVYPRVTSMVDGTGTTTFAYNAVSTAGANQVSTETGPLGSTAAISYAYDALGRRTDVSINSVGSSVTYDSLSRITAATNVLGTFTYGYNGATRQLQSLSNDQNGLNTAYSYQTGLTQDFRLTDISNYSSGTTVLSRFDYAYNPIGSIASWRQQADSSAPTVWNLGYDNVDQLTSATQLNTSTSAVLSQNVYGYDMAGNRNSNQSNLNVTQTSYNNLNQITGSSAGGPLRFAGSLSKPAKVSVAGQPATYGNNYSTNFSGLANVTSGTNSVAVVATDVNGNSATNNYQVVVPPGGSISPTYDSDGNMTSNGNDQAYSWDAENELVGIVYSSGPNSGNHTEFTYDGLGRRIAIIERTGTSPGSGTVTSTKKFIWNATQIAEERDASGTTVTGRFFPQGEQIAGSSYYYTRDHLGSVRELCNSSGTLFSRYSYDLFGQVTITHATANTTTPPVDAELQYAGYYEHGTSGLNLALYRAYNSSSGRWLSRDPAGEKTGPNLYDYVENNPVNSYDPFGLATVHFWAPPPGAGYGHLSITLDDGTYISNWPSNEGNILASSDTLPPNYAHDASEEGSAPTDLYIAGLDELAMKIWWDLQSRRNGYNGFGANCSSSVANALRQGGLPVSSTYPYYPSDTWPLILNAAAGNTSFTVNGTTYTLQ